MLSHTERFCKKKLETNDGAITKDRGHWLRAPPRKTAGGSKSKWLREEGDGDWGRQKGRDTHRAENQGFQNTRSTRPTTDLRVQRDSTNNKADISGYSVGYENNMQPNEGNSKMSNTNGLDSDELYGLNLEERKRQRVDASSMYNRQNRQISQPRALLFLMRIVWRPL